MQGERFEEIMRDFGVGNSRRILSALQQVAHEVEQKLRKGHSDAIKLLREELTHPEEIKPIGWYHKVHNLSGRVVSSCIAMNVPTGPLLPGEVITPLFAIPEGYEIVPIRKS